MLSSTLCGVVSHEDHEGSEEQESEMDESGEESSGDDPDSDSGVDIDGVGVRVESAFHHPTVASL